MKRHLGILASLITLFLVTSLNTTPVLAPPSQVCWSDGWDTFGALGGPVGTPSPEPSVSPLPSCPSSHVQFVHPDSQPMLNIIYVISGITSIASTTHRVGFHLFWASTANCVGVFGTLTGGFGGTLSDSNCSVATRQSITSAFESFEVGDLSLDGTGSGTLSVTISSIPSGTYTLEFDMRTTSCTFCNVILQAPGPVYSLGTVSITI